MSSYNSKIKQSRGKAYNQHIATKILDLLEKLKSEQSENSSRRWVWELLQNAKDVAYEERQIRIEIDFHSNDEEGVIEFRHNGKPFTTDNVTFLIEQVSSKERKSIGAQKIKTTGKFGTGFLTTHLLSEEVEIEGVMKEPDEPHKRFNILLDRSGQNIDEIINSVNASLSSLDGIDSQEAYDEYSADDFNTVFRYKLDGNGIEVAKKGLEDLHIALTYSMVFLPEIKLIKVNEDIEYELSKEHTEIGEDIKIYSVNRSELWEESESLIAVLNKNDTSIAIEIEYIEDRIFLKEFDSLLPKLFCDFPLIGTEDFSFPVVVNSPLFNPNEPRDGVPLTDRKSEKIIENKSIMKEAVELYYSLLEYASSENWGNIHLLAKIPKQNEKSWISREWFRNEIIKPIRSKLLITPIVDNENGKRISIKRENGKSNVWFPSSQDKNIRIRIWELANMWIPMMLPRKDDIDIWYDLIWSDCSKLTIGKITEIIDKKMELSKIDEMLVEEIDPIDWLNMYYKLLNLDQSCLDEVITDTFSVIPNQKGIFKKRSELRIDQKIDEELKNAMEILDIDTRNYLKYKKAYTGEIKYVVKNQEEIVDEMNRVINEGKHENLASVCDYIITLFSDKRDFPKKREVIYQFCKTLYPDDISEKRVIANWTESIWQEVDKREIEWLVDKVADNNNIIVLTSLLNKESSLQTLDWLNNFVSFLTDHDFEHKLNLKKKPILPNQNGDFCIKDDLFLDDGEIVELLKDISTELGYDIRGELLDKNIYLELPDNRTKNNSHVAEEIMKLITPKINEYPRSDETKKMFNKLYLWFIQNKQKAQELFSYLYEDRHRLCDDEEIAKNIQKAENLTEIMEEFGIDDISSLRQALIKGRNTDIYNQREDITQETLVSLGVTSLEELEDALKDEEIAARFIHTSTPTVEMFQYVQGLISRAKTNIIAHLKKHPEYDCSNLEVLANTVIGGITKEGLMINVVVRPSDNGEVIVYYTSEKDTLDYANAELWIDNDIDDPMHLTLGRILKKTGINRIPV